ncbi:Junction-mediating and -regulatory protein [Camelus dromedarius]|uniref:Junction-mediating and-regulatory protein n=1 Tax=Camelus dromedarius TaxID=9838 RepID=A0A5N4BZQ7_CAMDR|nr:Junction-mediating and -regulatory protein [Camelus dromedarius]
MAEGAWQGHHVFGVKERLQLDWVAWRLHVFYKRKKHKFIFIISWNEIEGKFVITCYNRMAQRQRSGTSGQSIPNLTVQGQVDQNRQKTQPEEAQKEKRREVGPLPPLLCRH